MSGAIGERHAAPEEPGVPVEGWVARYEWICLGVILLAVAAMAVLESRKQHLRFDELFTVIVATQPDWKSMMQALPADANPPLLHMMVRAVVKVLGPTDLAVRLPSMLAFLAACVFLHLLVRRRWGGVSALLAVALMVVQPGWAYAYDARPYALMLASMLLAMLGYETLVGGGRRWLGLAAMAVGIAASILSHNVGLMEVGLPLVVAEGVRLYRTRRPDWAMYGVCAVAAAASLAVTIPMMRHTHDLLLAVAAGAGVRPGLSAHELKLWVKNALLSLPGVMDLPVTALLVAMWVAGTRWGGARRGGEEERRIPAEWWALGWGAAALIPATFVVMDVALRYFNCRYGIGTIAGVALLGMLLVASGRVDRRMRVAVLLFCVAVFVLREGETVRETGVYPRGVPEMLAKAAGPGEPVLISDPSQYLEMWWYAGAQDRRRMFYLTDPAVTVGAQYAVLEHAVLLERPYVAVGVEDYRGFLQSHDRFLVYWSGFQTEPGLLERLRGSGYRLTLVEADTESKVYEAVRPQG